MKLTPTQWEIISDKMVEITRHANDMESWRTEWTTSAWRGMFEEDLEDLLLLIGVEVEL